MKQLAMSPDFLGPELAVDRVRNVQRIRPRRNPAPNRCIPGTAPDVPMPTAGSDLERRNRAGHKPGSMGPGVMSREEADAALEDELELVQLGVRFGPPPTLGGCRPGPCPHVGCAHHLYLDVIPSKQRKCAGIGSALIRSRHGGVAICRVCTRFFRASAIGAPAPPHRPAPTIKLNFPGKEVHELAETCSMRVANAAERAATETAIEDVARLMNLTHERTRQLQHSSIAKGRRSQDAERRR